MIEGFALPLLSTYTGSDTDLATLVSTYAPLLFRVAHSVLRSRPEAEDTVQDTFVRVLEHRGTLPNVRDIRPWLVRITWNLALDRQRRIRPEQINELFTATLASQTMPADQAMDEAQRMAAVLTEIDRLPREERQVLLLSTLEELSGAEIAKVLNRSESAVRSLQHRARTRLRERLTKGAKA